MDFEWKIMIGLVWLILGIVWLYRAMREEAHPDAPASLFAEPEAQTDKDRSWKVRLGVLNVMMGGVYVLSALFSHTR
jgi:hypothetical protein